MGKNVANPTAMLLCAAKMLNHVNLRFYGDMLRGAIDKVLKGGKVRLLTIQNSNWIQLELDSVLILLLYL